jgi:hypothetical protein
MGRKMDNEIETWLEVLAGRSSSAEDGAAAREARALREALQRSADSVPQSAHPADPTREASLLERARRLGLMPSRPARRRTWRFATWSALTTVTAVACTAVLVAVFLRPTPPVERVRGGGPQIVTLQAADPLAAKVELLRELRAAGVTAHGYERLGREGIDADLPRPVPQRIRTILARHRIPVPSDGVLEIEITPTQTQ